MRFEVWNPILEHAGNPESPHTADNANPVLPRISKIPYFPEFRILKGHAGLIASTVWVVL